MKTLRSSCDVIMAVSYITAEALPGVWENKVNRAFISGEQRNKGQILRGTGEQRQYWETGNIRKQILDFWEQGNKPIYVRGTREQVSPLGGSHCYGVRPSHQIVACSKGDKCPRLDSKRYNPFTFILGDISKLLPLNLNQVMFK